MFGRKMQIGPRLRILGSHGPLLMIQHPTGAITHVFREHLTKPADLDAFKAQLEPADHVRVQKFADGGEVEESTEDGIARMQKEREAARASGKAPPSWKSGNGTERAPEGSEGQAFEEPTPTQAASQRAYAEAVQRRLAERNAHPDGNADEDTPESRLKDAQVMALVDREPKKMAHGGAVPGMSIVSETPEVLLVRHASGAHVPIVKSAHSAEELNRVRMMCGGTVQHMSGTGDGSDPVVEEQDAPDAGQTDSAPAPTLTPEQAVSQTQTADAGPAPTGVWDRLETGLRHLTGEEGIAGPEAPIVNAPPTGQAGFVDTLAHGPAALDAALAEKQAAEATAGAPVVAGQAGPPAPSPEEMAVRRYEDAIRAAGVGTAKRPGGGVPGIPDFTGRLATDDQTIKDALGKSSHAEGQIATDVQHYYRSLAKIQEQQNGANATAATVFDSVMTQRAAHAQEMMNDIDRFKIDPTRKWQSMGAGGQALAAFSMILGGVGQGLSHSTVNYGMQVIDKAIDQDIAAQRDELGKKNTLLGRYMAQTGDLRSAEAFTRADTYRRQAAEIKALGDKSSSDIEKQKALIAAQGWNIKAGEEDRKGAALAGQMAGERAAGVIRQKQGKLLDLQMQAEQAKVDQQKADSAALAAAVRAGDVWAPDRYAQAKNPKGSVSDVEDAGSDSAGHPLTRVVKRYLQVNASADKAREALLGSNETKGKLAELERFAKAHPWGGAGWEDGSKGQALARDLSLSFNKTQEGNNRLNDTELELIQDMVGKPTSWYQSWTGQEAAKLNVLHSAVNRKHQAILDAYTIPDPPSAR